MSHRTRILVTIVLVAAGVRCIQAILVPGLPADAIEYQNVADNLRAGRGFVLDLEVYHAYGGAVGDYSGYTRPHGLPLLLAALQCGLPSHWVSVLLGPLLFVLSIVLVVDWLGAVGLRREAPWVGAMLALQPGLIDVSIRPLTEPLTIACVTLALWAHTRLRSPVLAGLASAAAFVTRPTAAVAGIVLGFAYLAGALRHAAWRDLVAFSAAAIAGPIFVVSVNVASGAPALLGAQSFLWRAVSDLDGLRFVNRGGLYPSTAALVADRGLGWIAGAVLRNALAYARQVVGLTPGLGCLIPLLVFAPIGAKCVLRGTGLGMLATIGALDLGTYCLVWATQDVYRFVALFYFAAVVAGGALAARGLFVVGDRIGGVAGRALAPVALGAVRTVWTADTAVESRAAIRGERVAYDDSNAIARLVALDESRVAGRVLRDHLGPASRATSPPVASNEAWLVLRAYDRPAFILPYDLRADEWLPFLRRRSAGAVLLHVASWPRDERDRLHELTDALREGGWTRALAQGELEVWIPPSPATTPPSAPHDVSTLHERPSTTATPG